MKEVLGRAGRCVATCWKSFAVWGRSHVRLASPPSPRRCRINQHKDKLMRIVGVTSPLHSLTDWRMPDSGVASRQLRNLEHKAEHTNCRMRGYAPDSRAMTNCKYLKTNEGGGNDSFAKPLYGLTPVSRVRIPLSPPVFQSQMRDFRLAAPDCLETHPCIFHS